MGIYISRVLLVPLVREELLGDVKVDVTQLF